MSRYAEKRLAMNPVYPTLEEIRSAARRIEPHIHRTPVLTCRSLNDRVGADLFFKCENFQKVGAFKIRGAMNAVLTLSEQQARRGVATHSSGNHAAALALAARIGKMPAYVVMPETAPVIKQKAVAGYGAQITLCMASLKAREQALVGVVERTGATVIHPYNDYRVIAGQATATLELLAQAPALDMVMTPIGGGGLTSGAALAVAYLSPQTRLVAAEPLAADDAYRSLRAGQLMPSENPCSMADGLLTALGDKTFGIIRQWVDDIVTVPEQAISDAMRHIWERMKIVVEPSAAVPLGALLTGKLDPQRQRIGIILSGGNVDLERLPWLSQ